ncbi:MAG: hypothetical protein ACLQVX_20520 [Limisphaerales bacterium]
MKTPKETLQFLGMAAREAASAGVIRALLLLAASGALIPVFDSQNNSPSNQSDSPWALGGDFTVNSPTPVGNIEDFCDGGHGFGIGVPVALAQGDYSLAPDIYGPTGGCHSSGNATGDFQELSSSLWLQPGVKRGPGCPSRPAGLAGVALSP